MPDHEESSAWAVLACTPGLGVSALSTALGRLGSAAAVMAASAAERERAGLPAPSAAYLSSTAARCHRDRARRGSPRHQLLPFQDPRFPRPLLDLPDCPVAVYVAGNVAALAQPQLAVVGSRNPSPQGRENAAAFAAALGRRGLAITSGAAAGIDAAAHLGALDVQAQTIAVLGTGIDVAYPPVHGPLLADIERYGALLSEFAPGTPPRRGNFPRRNRLIAALSLGTLVVEATRRSGSLLTARRAVTCGRAVFAIPGSIHSAQSGGCHQLIKAGAKLVETPADILSGLNFSAFFANDLRPPTQARRAAPRPAGMDKDRKILLDALGFDPVDLDTLVVRTGFKPEAVSSMVLILELEGHVQAAPGGRYSRVAYRRAGGER